MKPAPFEFIRPNSVSEVIRVLGESGGEARVVAGAQSLGPMLNLRLVQPQILVDITGIPELTRVEEDGAAVTIGACVTTANIEDGRLPGGGLPALREVAAHIAYRAVRNRGTIGGSLCHAAPSADWVAALCALGAECLLIGANGTRRMPVEQFITGAFENALAPAELLEAVRVPRPSAGSGWGYNKLCRKTGEFAIAIGAVLNDPERGRLRIALGAARGRPIVLADARALWDRDASALDPGAFGPLLDDAAITDRAARRQHAAVLNRAFRQAMGP
jgi:carbon-monoxide dehydrogenase medium subunit